MPRRSYFEELNHKERMEEKADYEQAERIRKRLQGKLAPSTKEYIKLKKAEEKRKCRR